MVELGTTKTFAFAFLLLLSLCSLAEKGHVNISTESFPSNSSPLPSYSRANLSEDLKSGICMERKHVCTRTVSTHYPAGGSKSPPPAKHITGRGALTKPASSISVPGVKKYVLNIKFLIFIQYNFHRKKWDSSVYR